MDYRDISNLREVVGKYLENFGPLSYTLPHRESFDEVTQPLHDCIKGFDLDGVRGVLDLEDPHNDDLLSGFSRLIDYISEMVQLFKEYGDTILEHYDENAIEARDFAVKALPIFEAELEHLKYRRLHEATRADKESVNWIERWLAGKSMEKTLNGVLRKYVFKGLSFDNENRRAEYLLTYFADNAEVINAIRQMLSVRDSVNNAMQIIKVISPAQTSTSGDTISIETHNNPSGDPAMPDFNNMESYSSTIKLNIDELYSCLKSEKVLVNISKDYLSKCIYHARLDLLLECPQKKNNKLKYTFHILKEWMEDNWIEAVCKFSGFTASQLSGANLTDKKKFANKIKSSLKKPQ